MITTYLLIVRFSKPAINEKHILPPQGVTVLCVLYIDVPQRPTAPEWRPFPEDHQNKDVRRPNAEEALEVALKSENGTWR